MVGFKKVTNGRFFSRTVKTFAFWDLPARSKTKKPLRMTEWLSKIFKKTISF